jgi:hypothetical protein
MLLKNLELVIKNAFKKEKSNFMWGPEHKFYGRQRMITRIELLA